MAAKTQIAPGAAPAPPVAAFRPTPVQLSWLRSGLDQAGGKLPMFDTFGQRISERTIRSCVGHGWAEPWFDNPLKPGWLICKLTDGGRQVATQG